MAATTNPLHGTQNSSDLPVSSKTITIAGILVDVHGLEELPASPSSVACLWLLNPRLQTKETMAPIARRVISTWNKRVQDGRAGTRPKGLIAAAFDQRNHGSRKVDDLHNQAWREGNETHAQDMFGCFHGTATDTSQLINHLESYIFTAKDSPKIQQHFALGISLGGHATWHCLLGDPRITAGVVGIGCPDYTRLLTDRARLSKRKTYKDTTPPGSAFLGSPDFPQALQDAIAQYDPAGLLLPGMFNPLGDDTPPDQAQLTRMKALMKEKLQGKRILNLSGQADKLVPYSAGEPFYKIFKQVLAEDSSLDIVFEDVLFEGVEHAFPKPMADKAAEWLCDILATDDGPVSISSLPNMTNTPAPEHRIPRYHAFSTLEEQEAYIDMTDSLDTSDSAASPSLTLTEISLLHQEMNPKPWRDIEPNESPYDSSGLPGPKHDSSGRLTAMLTLYDLAMSCEEIEEADWDEYITPYESDDLEMLEQRFPRKCWPPEIEASWPNLVVLARWKTLSQGL